MVSISASERLVTREMPVRNGQSLTLANDSNNSVAPDMVFNFSLNVAYDIILKSQKSDVLFPEIEVILIVIYIVLISFGVVSNVLVCFVVMKQCARKKMDLQKCRNLYIVNLAVADLALCCICMPFTLIALIQREWTFGSLLCKLVPVVQGTNITVSAGTIMAIAFDRYNTIVKSSRSNGFHRRKCSRIIVTILLIWLLSFTVTSPLFFYTVTESVTFDNFFLYEKCIERWPSRSLYSAFTITLALVQFVIPVLVLTFIHVKISSYLKIHLKPLNTIKPEILIHSPRDPVEEDKKKELQNEEKSAEGVLKKELLNISRKQSIGSDTSQKSCGTSRKSSNTSRKNSDSSRNSCELSPRKRSDFLLTFLEVPDSYGFSFSRFSDKSKSGNSQKRREIKRNRRTTFILSCIALVYGISWLPMTIFQIASTLIPEENQNPETIYVIFAICHVLAMSSAISNPLLYGWLNTNFRKEFLNIFSCTKNFYSKLRTSRLRKKAMTQKVRENNFLVQIPPNDLSKAECSLEHGVSLNYSNGKIKSTLVAPLPNSLIKTV